jgi:hypothetical protein
LRKDGPSFNNVDIKNHLNTVNIEIEDYPPKFDEKTLVQKSVVNHYIYSQLVEPIEWN